MLIAYEIRLISDCKYCFACCIHKVKLFGYRLEVCLSALEACLECIGVLFVFELNAFFREPFGAVGFEAGAVRADVFLGRFFLSSILN